MTVLLSFCWVGALVMMETRQQREYLDESTNDPE